MGFANKLRYILAKDQSIGWSLFGFNLGLEAGQIVIVFLVLMISFLSVQLLKINRREWVIFASAAAFSIALKMALERIP
jgi:hypothetical protein